MAGAQSTFVIRRAEHSADGEIWVLLEYLSDGLHARSQSETRCLYAQKTSGGEVLPPLGGWRCTQNGVEPAPSCVFTRASVQ